MAVRVTTSEVKVIIETSLTDVDAFIVTANTFLNDALSVDIAAGDVSAAMLVEIEKWLSAHFVAIRDPQIKSEKIGETAATYRGQEEMGLKATTYGQQAIALDPTGRLSEIDKRRSEVKVIDTDA